MTGTTTNKTMPSRKRTSLAALSLVLTANSGLVSGFQSVNSRQGVPQSYVRQQHCGRQNSCHSLVGGQHHSSLPPPTVTALHISTPSASSIDSGEADITSGATGGDISQQQQHQHQTQDVVATSAASESMEINSISSTGTKDEKKKGSKINKVEHAQNEITSADKAVLWTTVAGIVAAFAAVTQISGPGAWKYYVAGGICAAFSHGITTPIDVVKTRLQVDPALRGKGMVKATMKIVKNDGIQTLLAGLGPTTWGYLFEGAVKFGIYEVLKPAVRQILVWLATATSIASLNNKVLGFLICGGVSGVAASLMLCPMEALRIRLVSEPDFDRGEGWVHGFLRMVKYEGVGGLWKGINAMMLKQVPYTVTKNVSFDFITTALYLAVKGWNMTIDANMKLLIPLVSAFAASVLSTVTSQPGDMLLSAVNAHEGDQTVWDFSRDIREKEGLKGYFRGMRARFLHVGLIVTAQLLIYDIVKRLVGIAATGST